MPPSTTTPPPTAMPPPGPATPKSSTGCPPFAEKRPGTNSPLASACRARSSSATSACRPASSPQTGCRSASSTSRKPYCGSPAVSEDSSEAQAGSWRRTSGESDRVSATSCAPLATSASACATMRPCASMAPPRRCSCSCTRSRVSRTSTPKAGSVAAATSTTRRVSNPDRARTVPMAASHARAALVGMGREDATSGCTVPADETFRIVRYRSHRRGTVPGGRTPAVPPGSRAPAGWCGWSGSNRHSLRNRILSPARLPIPPHPRRPRRTRGPRRQPGGEASSTAAGGQTASRGFAKPCELGYVAPHLIPDSSAGRASGC